MNKAQKQQAVQQLTEDLKNNHVYFANSQGLNAEEVTQIRHACFKAGVKYRVVKNTLLLKALQKIDNPQLDLGLLEEKVLKGFTGIFIVQENPSQPAKIIQAFHKDTKLKKPALKAAFVYEELHMGAQHLKALTQLKSKEELIAEVIQLLQGPTQNLLSALQSPGGNLTGSLQTLAEKENNDKNT